MGFVAEKTTIPVPPGDAFRKNRPVSSAFILIDYVDGHTLSDMDRRLTCQQYIRERCHLQVS
ncbi:MAG: hypothetical protein M1813_005450 [Trichoglossum hirsutum]|nr:MAG: hypothetical protein M1813_005450 [Trichoglossum hirsutum]